MKDNVSKIGILTFNRALNYGAVLQAFALKSVCEQAGYSVQIVDYWKEKHSFQNKVRRPLSDPKAMIKFALEQSGAKYIKKQKSAFKNFRDKYLDETQSCSNKGELEALDFDAYIIGSDQIWNYKITGGNFDPVYFGDFLPDKLKIIYAGSSHDTPFPLRMEDRFKNHLKSCKAVISIREQKLADYVAQITGTEYPVVLDPTLLAGRDIFDRLTENEKAETDPYILIYQIDSNPYSDISVRTLEKRFNCKTYTMTVPRIDSKYGRRGTAGPEEFLTLLKNAEMVVTNSFHGIALSLLFEKQFFVYEHDGVMTRIDGLLEAVGLYDRKVRLVNDIDVNKTIDYESVNQKLSILRTNSRKFLFGALAGTQFAVPAEIKPFVLPLMRKRQKKECSGCTACAELCPVSAISMKADEEGFLYPVINETECIHCGICDRVCGFIPKQKTDQSMELPEAYGVKHKDEYTRITSRSGAAFIAFSDLILEKNGVVYGAAFADHFEVQHIRAESKAERDRMKNAKYVQSSQGDQFKNVENDLKNDRYVLYSGTPCQISGLLGYLKARNVDTSTLYTCDLVCHGTPSPMVWNDYIQFIEDKYKNKIASANFRDKEFGWDSHCESFVLENGKKIVSRDYTDLFYNHVMFRPSCYNCYYANIKRVADLTLADFWGIEKNSNSFNDNKGVSLVLVNTAKGKNLFNEARSSFYDIECKLYNCIQPTLVKPSSKSILRDDFWADYKELPFAKLLKKYTTPVRTIPRMKRIVKNTLYHLHIRSHP